MTQSWGECATSKMQAEPLGMGRAPCRPSAETYDISPSIRTLPRQRLHSPTGAILGTFLFPKCWQLPRKSKEASLLASSAELRPPYSQFSCVTVAPPSHPASRGAGDASKPPPHPSKIGTGTGERRIPGLSGRRRRAEQTPA